MKDEEIIAFRCPCVRSRSLMHCPVKRFHEMISPRTASAFRDWCAERTAYARDVAEIRLTKFLAAGVTSDFRSKMTAAIRAGR